MSAASESMGAALMCEVGMHGYIRFLPRVYPQKCRTVRLSLEGPLGFLVMPLDIGALVREVLWRSGVSRRGGTNQGGPRSVLRFLSHGLAVVAVEWPKCKGACSFVATSPRLSPSLASTRVPPLGWRLRFLRWRLHSPRGADQKARPP